MRIKNLISFDYEKRQDSEKRIATAITGTTPEGANIKGDYKFTDEFPMAEGFEENAEFFTLNRMLTFG
jgi:hypothetical protein